MGVFFLGRAGPGITLEGRVKCRMIGVVIPSIDSEEAFHDGTDPVGA